MKLNENIKIIKNIIETSNRLNEMDTIGNRTWFDDNEYNAFEKVLNKMLSGKYSWWKKIDVNYMTYDSKEKKLNFSGDLTLNQDWVDSLDYDLELDGEEVTWLSDFLTPEDAFKIRDDFADSFLFVFGLPTNSVRYNVEVLVDEPQDINEEIEDNQLKKDLSPLIRKLLQSIIDRNSDIICDIEVTAPWNRETIEPNKSFEFYKILITFIGGSESGRWPKTMAIHDKNDEIMDEIWSLVYDVIGEATDLYLTEEPRCR
jgi:hypothetical protein